MAQFIKLCYAPGIRPKYENNIIQSYCRISSEHIHANSFKILSVLYIVFENTASYMLFFLPLVDLHTPLLKSGASVLTTAPTHQMNVSLTRTTHPSGHLTQSSCAQGIRPSSMTRVCSPSKTSVSLLISCSEQEPNWPSVHLVYKTVITIGPWVHLTEKLRIKILYCHWTVTLDSIRTVFKKQLLKAFKAFDDIIGLNCEIICHCKSTNIALKQYSELLPKTQGTEELLFSSSVSCGPCSSVVKGCCQHWTHTLLIWKSQWSKEATKLILLSLYYSFWNYLN